MERDRASVGSAAVGIAQCSTGPCLVVTWSAATSDTGRYIPPPSYHQPVPLSAETCLVSQIRHSAAGRASMKRIKHRTHDGSRVIVLAGAAGDVAKSQSSYTAISFTSLSVSPNRSSTPLPLPVVSEVVKLVYPSQCLYDSVLAVRGRGISVSAPTGRR